MKNEIAEDLISWKLKKPVVSLVESAINKHGAFSSERQIDDKVLEAAIGPKCLADDAGIPPRRRKKSTLGDLIRKRDKMAWQFEIQLQIMLALHEHTKY